MRMETQIITAVSVVVNSIGIIDTMRTQAG